MYRVEEATVPRTIFGLACLCLIPMAALAQTTGKISGIILDDKKQPVIGANVMLEGTTLGASTDVEGKYFIINVPPQLYVLRASAVGFAPYRVQKVDVVPGLTTRVDISLTPSDVQMAEVVVEHTRPPVQKDLTSKIQGFDAADIDKLPVQNSLVGLVTTQAGITSNIVTTPVSSQPVFGQFATIPNDGLHFRGGRTNETLYLLDGVSVNDQLWGGFDLEAMGQYSLQSIRTLTGTFGPQYGEAMSGVVEMQTMDNVPQTYTVRGLAFTDQLGTWSNDEGTTNFELQASGPVPGVSTLAFFGSARLYRSDGYLFGYIYPNYIDSEGRDRSGTPEEVSMGYRDSELLFGKLIWQVTEAMKLRGGIYYTENQRGAYNHYFKYNPYGTPHVMLRDKLIYGRFTHVLSPTTFYDVALSEYRRSFKSFVFDSPAEYAVRPETGSAEFSTSGEDFVRFESVFRRLEFQANITSQVTKEHQISAGGIISRLGTALERVNPNGDELAWSVIEDYDLTPWKYGAYVNDKMEFEDMGMVVNVGLRWDLINPNREYITDITSPEGEVAQAPTRSYFSPRFGISYPISDVAAFRFGYGHYYQYPDFFKTFQGLNEQYPLYPRPNVRSVVGAVATGDIQEEKTINYEFGVQLRLSSALSADVTGFYRKISNLIGTVVIEGYLSTGDVTTVQKFPAFDNVGSATVKGVEVSFSKRFSNYFSGFLNYTYAEALTTSSVLFSIPRDEAREYPADWDQSHVASVGLSFEFPQAWGFSLLGTIASGLPYTYTQFQPNAERAPWIGTFDIMAFKEFDVTLVKLRLFAQVVNLFNRRNVWWVWPDSGQPGVDANPSTSDDYTNDPSMWGPGRRFQVGLSFTL